MDPPSTSVLKPSVPPSNSDISSNLMITANANIDITITLNRENTEYKVEKSPKIPESCLYRDSTCSKAPQSTTRPLSRHEIADIQNAQLRGTPGRWDFSEAELMMIQENIDAAIKMALPDVDDPALYETTKLVSRNPSVQEIADIQNSEPMGTPGRPMTEAQWKEFQLGLDQASKATLPAVDGEGLLETANPSRRILSGQKIAEMQNSQPMGTPGRLRTEAQRKEFQKGMDEAKKAMLPNVDDEGLYETMKPPLQIPSAQEIADMQSSNPAGETPSRLRTEAQRKAFQEDFDKCLEVLPGVDEESLSNETPPVVTCTLSQQELADMPISIAIVTPGWAMSAEERKTFQEEMDEASKMELPDEDDFDL